MPQTLVILAELKVDTQENLLPSVRSPVAIHFTIAPGRGTTVFFGQDEVFWLLASDVRGGDVAVDTTSSFHSYRIEVETTESGFPFRVYQDGDLIITGSTPASTNSYPYPEIWFGDGTTYSGGQSRWRSFEHNAVAARVNGSATLDGYLASVVGELLEVEVWQNDAVVETLDGNYGPNGTFAFSPATNGPAVLKFRFRTGLWKAVPVTLGPTPIENLTVNMTNGDCDHDNEVGIGDYALLSAIYGLSVGDPGYDTNADLNGDTTVDIADYAILSGSYGEVGD